MQPHTQTTTYMVAVPVCDRIGLLEEIRLVKT